MGLEKEAIEENPTRDKRAYGWLVGGLGLPLLSNLLFFAFSFSFLVHAVVVLFLRLICQWFTSPTCLGVCKGVSLQTFFTDLKSCIVY
jgi:hypothetical protein